MTLKNKLFFVIFLFLAFGFVFTEVVSAEYIEPNCYTGKGACGAGGGNWVFTVADQVTTCNKNEERRQDCIQLFCVQRIKAGGAFSEEQLNEICRQLGYGSGNSLTKPTIKPTSQPTPTTIVSPTPTISKVVNPPQVENQKQNSLGILSNIKNFFINIFRRIFGR